MVQVPDEMISRGSPGLLAQPKTLGYLPCRAISEILVQPSFTQLYVPLTESYRNGIAVPVAVVKERDSAVLFSFSLLSILG